MDGSRENLEFSDLQDEVALDALISRLRDAEIIEFEIRDLLGLTDEIRHRLFQLIALNPLSTIQLPAPRRDDRSNPPFSDLFEAALAAMEGLDDITRCERGRRAALEAAAIVHPEAPEIAIAKIQARLRALKIPGFATKDLRQQHQDLLAERTSTNGPAQLAEAYLATLATEFKMPPSTPLLRRLANDYARWNGRCWQWVDESTLRDRLSAFLQNQEGVEVTRSLLDNVLVNLNGLVFLDPPRLELRPPFFVTSNGAIDDRRAEPFIFQNGLLRFQDAMGETLRLRSHDPRWFATVCLPYDFDPEAECPLWRQTLADILPSLGDDDHRIDLLQELFGWTLAPNGLGLQHFVILVGDGANGKSTVMEIWRQFLGRENCAAVPLDHIDREFRLVELDGKRANLVADMNRPTNVAEGMLKQLTSGDTISVNRKYKTPIMMQSTAKQIFATNELPSFGDRSEGIWRRLIVLPFLEHFRDDDIDRSRISRLQQELPGIFLWALQGARRLQHGSGFTRCGVCRAAAEDHKIDSDPVRQFVAERCQFGSSYESRSNDIYQAYKEWCDDNGRKALSSSPFFKHLRKIAEGDKVSLQRVRRSVGERLTGSNRPYIYQGIVIRNK